MGIEEISERISRTEEILRSHSDTLIRLENRSEALLDLRTMVIMQTEVNKEQHIQMREFSQTLSKINDNLTHMNIIQDQLKRDMGKIGERVSSIEESQDENKIDVSKLMVKVIIGIVMIIPTLITAYILSKTGFK